MLPRVDKFSLEADRLLDRFFKRRSFRKRRDSLGLAKMAAAATRPSTSDMKPLQAGITLASLAQQWRSAVHCSLATVRINPGSPAFVASVRHLHEAYAMMASLDQLTVVAIMGAVGTLVTLAQRVAR